MDFWKIDGFRSLTVKASSKTLKVEASLLIKDTLGATEPKS